MNDQSVVSSSLDTDGNMYHPNNKKGGAPKVKQFCMRELNQVMQPQNPFNPN